MKMNVQFEQGDVVRLVDQRPVNWASNGDMDKFLGTIQVVKEAGKYNDIIFFNPITYSWAFRTNGVANYQQLTLNSAQISLLNEAYARFPEGTKFLSAMSGKRFTSKGLLYPKMENGFLNILDKGENYIYYRGQWANLREDKTLLFGEHKVQYHKADDVLTVGCKNINPDDLEALLCIAEDYNITSLTVDHTSNIPTSELQKWNDLINKQQ
jgi:hypothetical protein